MEQTAAKLSVYLRDGSGKPIVPTEEQLPGFPDPSPVDELQLDQDIQMAQNTYSEYHELTGCASTKQTLQDTQTNI